MNRKYPLVSMSEFLQHRKEFFRIDDEEEYQLVTVQLHARGIKPRKRMFGREIKTKRQQRIRGGDLLVAEIDAKAGGYGIVPEDLAGAIVSSHYFLYEIDETVIEPEFLKYYLRSGNPEFDIQEFVQGSLNYAAVRAHHFSELKIPLPPLVEQRGIVAQINAIEQRLKSVEELQTETDANLHGLLVSAYKRITESVSSQHMQEVAPLVRRKVEIDPDAAYPELGIRSFGRGTFHKPAIPGNELGNKRLYQIKAGDLLFSNVFSWEGAVAVAQPEDDGRYGSHRFITRLPEPEVVTAKFLCFHFLTEEGLRQLQDASPGSAGRNRTLGLKALDAIQVPVPPIKAQLWFNALYDKAQALRQWQEEVNQEAKAIMPSVLDKAFRGEL